MAGSLLPEPKQQFLNDIGDPLFAGQIFTYAAGTLTPKATYQDQALTILNTNPVVANARGEVIMYGTGSYRVILKDSFGNTIYDRDDISIVDLSASNGSELIGNGGESVAQSFNALQLVDYGALRAYVGPRKAVYVTGYLVSASPTGSAGSFIPDPSDTTSIDNGGTIIVSSNGMRWKRQYKGGVDVCWWGAKFDNVTEDAPAIQACINYAQPLQKQIICPVGTAKISTQLNIPFSLFGLNLSGQGKIKTRFNYTGISPSTDACIYITGHSGQKCGAVIDGIGFDGLTASTTAIVIAGQNGQFIRRCQFAANYNGVVFRNSVAGQFSEYNVVEDCDFTASCRTAMWYNVVGAGDVSFHGSGMRNSTVNTPSSVGYRCILIDPTAIPYNSPMDVQVWGNATGTFIDMAGYGTGRPYFTGTITTETFSPGLVLCNAPVGRELPLVGKVAGVSANFSRGTLFTVDAVVDNIAGGRQTIGGRFSVVQQLTTGANSVIGIPTCMKQGLVTYVLNIVGPNYNFRYMVSTFSKENSGLSQIMATYSTFNSPGWGPPTFSVDAVTNALVITNASYPASGVFANVDVVQSGQSIYDPFFV